MNKIEQLANNLGNIDIPEIVSNILRNQKTLNEIARIVRDRLYLDGTDSDGNKLKTDSAKIQGNAAYSGFTYQKKRQKGQRSDNVTLRDTGGFYRSIKAQVPFRDIQITGDFDKDFGHIYDNFRTSYSGEKQFEDAILGVTEKQLEYIRWQLVYPELIKILNNKISGV